MLDSYIQILAENKLLLCFIVAIFSLCVGSFLNVVIYRLPLILNQEWKNECETFLNLEPSNSLKKLTLSSPPSSCPRCNQHIKWHQNIPVVSWLLLKGKCSNCANPISYQYPAIEILTATLSTIIAYQFGPTLELFAGLIFIWLLIPLAFIDSKEQILPDRIVFPFIGAGLFFSIFNVFINSQQAVIGTLIGFLCLWVVFKIFEIITGKQGMGYGDFKILAGFGAWMGASSLISIIVISSVLATIAGFIILSIRKESKPFAYGPYLILAAIITFMIGPIL